MITITVNKFFLFLIVLFLALCIFVRFIVAPVLEYILENFGEEEKDSENESDRSM